MADDHLAKLEGKIHDAKIPMLALMLVAGSWCRLAPRVGYYLPRIAALQSGISAILAASRHFMIGRWRDRFEVDYSGSRWFSEVMSMLMRVWSFFERRWEWEA